MEPLSPCQSSYQPWHFTLASLMLDPLLLLHPVLRPVVASLTVVALLQRHLPLGARLEPGRSVEAALELHHRIEMVVVMLLTHLHLLQPSHMADILDTQFLLFTVRRIAMNAVMKEPCTSLESLFSAEAVRAPSLLHDLQQLDCQLDLASLCSRDQGKNLNKMFTLVKAETLTMSISLLKINNPLYESYTHGQPLQGDRMEGETTQQYKLFEEKYHWHTMKKLSDDYDRTKDNNKTKSFSARKSMQKQANFMMR